MQWLLVGALLVAIVLECSCVGVWWSQRAKSTASATGATLGTFCVVWIVVPILFAALLHSPTSRSFEDAMFYWHPFVGVIELLTQPTHYPYNYDSEQPILLAQHFTWMMSFHLGVAATFFALTLRRFRRANRLERD